MFFDRLSHLMETGTAQQIYKLDGMKATNGNGVVLNGGPLKGKSECALSKYITAVLHALVYRITNALPCTLALVSFVSCLA